MIYESISTIGQDSHRFIEEENKTAQAGSKPLVLGGFKLPADCGAPGLAGNSDADVILHAITNAVSGLTGVNILGAPADKLCRQGITDSVAYLKLALESMPEGASIRHLSISLEGKRPKLSPHIPAIKEQIASLLGIPVRAVGLTATTGEGLTDFGRGLGLQAFCIMTFRMPVADGPVEG